MIYWKFRKTFDMENDTFRLEFLLVPVISLSFLVNYSNAPMEVSLTPRPSCLGLPTPFTPIPRQGAHGLSQRFHGPASVAVQAGYNSAGLSFERQASSEVLCLPTHCGLNCYLSTVQSIKTMFCGRLRCGKTDLTHLSLYFHRRQWKGTATEVQAGERYG